MHLQAPKGRVILKVDREQKNFYTLDGGPTIRLERAYNNLDRKYTQQVLGTCLASEEIPAGALVLFHFNSIHPVNTVYNYGHLSGEEIASGIVVVSLSESECFLWKLPGDPGPWHPCKGFATALRVFKPYRGFIQGIEPTKLPNTLYVTSGSLKGQVVKTLTACDLSIIFRNERGVDEEIIRFRHFDSDEEHEREEVQCIMHELGEMVEKGELWVGLHPRDARPLNP
jgi:hypothetical protein